jgi:hypothetical protein
MARKSNVSSDGPSTADVSASEDVEMQDQETTQLSGLKKLGVSAPPWVPSLSAMGTAGFERLAREAKLIAQSQYFQDTPDYTVRSPPKARRATPTCKLTLHQDSDTNPNTTASSVAGDAAPDGRKKRSEVMNMRKSIIGKKHDRLGASKVGKHSGACARGRNTDMTCSHRKMILSAVSDICLDSQICSAISSTPIPTRTSRRLSPRSTVKTPRM